MSFDRPTSDAATSEVGWGILGTGLIARLFVTDLKLTGHQVVAVGSRTAGSAERFAAEFSIPHAYGTYEAMVADESVDIAYVATPHTRHRADASLALRAGKHVLVEKPFTINAAEARSVADLAAELGLLALEAMWTRWLPHMVAIRDLLARGALGDVRSVLADHTQKLPDDPAHRLNALELGGGALLDLGVYPISFASNVLGTPVSVDAVATFRETGADAETAVLLRYAEGRTAAIYTASNAVGPNRATIVGTDGRIEIDTVWYTPTSFRLYDNRGSVTSTFESHVPGRGMQYQAEEAERLIAASELTSHILPLSESIGIMSTMDQVRQIIGLRYPTE
ncbi:MAG: Gfo/Idh/MocA family protein [Solirubrobacteraceae bacterium]